MTLLFDPRRQPWAEHFARDGAYITGKTAIGRTTIRVLDMNSEDQIILRGLV